MAEFKIADADLEPVKGKVVVLTGGSSGIGLATTELLLQLGASVVSGDLNPPKADTAAAKHEKFTHVYCDVTSWADQASLFSAAMTKHGHINYVFANAGMATIPYKYELEEVDGKLQEPKHPMLTINFMGQVHTVQLGVHYLSKNQDGGGIVANASAAGFSSHGMVDYTAGKHGMLGLVRGLSSYLKGDHQGVGGEDWPASQVRINALAPSFTRTPILPEQIRSNPDFRMQTPQEVARCAAIFMADTKRHGEVAFIQDGRYWEVQAGFREAMQKLIPGGESLWGQGQKAH